MTGRFCSPIFRLFTILSLVATGGFAYSQTYYQNQEVQIQNLPVLVSPSHAPSDVLLTALDTVFHDKEICCGRDSALGDSAQAADPKSLKDVAAKLEGRHLMGDGRPIRVTAEYLTPGEVSAGHLISLIKDQHAPLLEWNSHLYVVYGVAFVWLEDASTGATAPIIKKLLLWDTRFSDSRRDVVFDRETEDPANVQGLLFLQSRAE